MTALNTVYTIQPMPESTLLRLTLDDYFPPTSNRTLGHHWARLLREKRRAFDQVYAAAAQARGLGVRFRGAVTVRITREWGPRQRALDTDNLHAGAKWLLDALRRPNGAEKARRLGIIESDTPAMCTLSVAQLAHPGPNRRLRTTIEIEGHADDQNAESPR